MIIWRIISTWDLCFCVMCCLLNLVHYLIHKFYSGSFAYASVVPVLQRNVNSFTFDESCYKCISMSCNALYLWHICLYLVEWEVTPPITRHVEAAILGLCFCCCSFFGPTEAGLARRRGCWDLCILYFIYTIQYTFIEKNCYAFLSSLFLAGPSDHTLFICRK